MLVLVSGATRTVRALAGDPHLGILITPRARQDLARVVAAGAPWAADNDCFIRLDAPAYKRMVGAVAGLSRLLWVACPDVVASHRRTMRRWRRWYPFLAARGVPVAFVAQNGCAPGAVPWGQVAAVFIGGDTDWKMGGGSRRHYRRGEAARRVGPHWPRQQRPPRGSFPAAGRRLIRRGQAQHVP